MDPEKNNRMTELEGTPRDNKSNHHQWRNPFTDIRRGNV